MLLVVGVLGVVDETLDRFGVAAIFEIEVLRIQSDLVAALVIYF